MHELSIAYNLVEIVQKTLEAHRIQHVEAVHLRLGVFSGVVEDALLFSYDIATEGTPLAGSQLIIQTLPLIVHCPNCQQDITLESIQLFQCPRCGTSTTDIRQGKEIEIEYLEIYDDETALT